MKTFEIMFSDLNPEAQKRYLEFQGVSNVSEFNGEICPIATVDLETIPDLEGIEGQDRDNYTDTQDRHNYITDEGDPNHVQN